MTKKPAFIVSFVFYALFTQAQHIGASPGYIRTSTTEWQGERFPDGRPKVPDLVLKRFHEATAEFVIRKNNDLILPFKIDRRNKNGVSKMA